MKRRKRKGYTMNKRRLDNRGKKGCRVRIKKGLVGGNTKGSGKSEGNE